MKKTPQDNKNHLSKLLRVYQERLRPPQASVERAVVEAIAEVTGYTLETAQVEYTVHTKTIRLKVSSLLKTELKKQQVAITARLQEKIPQRDVPQMYF